MRTLYHMFISDLSFILTPLRPDSTAGFLVALFVPAPRLLPSLTKVAADGKGGGRRQAPEQSAARIFPAVVHLFSLCFGQLAVKPCNRPLRTVDITRGWGVFVLPSSVATVAAADDLVELDQHSVVLFPGSAEVRGRDAVWQNVPTRQRQSAKIHPP